MTLRIEKKWRALGVAGALFVPALVTAAFSLPYTFKAGDPIKSAEVNANFEALRARLDAISGVQLARPTIGTLTLDGVVTASPIRGFTESIQVPVSNVGAGTGSAKPVFSDVQVTRDAGEGTPPLDLALNQQKHLASADIIMGNFSVHLTDVVLTDVTVAGVQAGWAQEKIGMSFSTVQWTWQEPKGTATVVGFDRVKGLSTGTGTLPAQFAYFAPGVAPDVTYVPISGYGQDMGCATPPCKVLHSALSVQKLVGVETLGTLAVAASTKHIAALGLTWFATATPSHSIKLTDLIVSNVSLSANDDGTIGETDGFAYATITWLAGKTQTAWDLTKGAAF